MQFIGERREQFETLEQLKAVIEAMYEEGQSPISYVHVEQHMGVQYLVARDHHYGEDCWIEECTREATQILYEDGDGAFGLFCDEHGWDDVPTEDVA